MRQCLELGAAGIELCGCKCCHISALHLPHAGLNNCKSCAGDAIQELQPADLARTALITSEGFSSNPLNLTTYVITSSSCVYIVHVFGMKFLIASSAVCRTTES